MNALETLYGEYQRGACEWCGKDYPFSANDHSRHYNNREPDDIFADRCGNRVACTALDFTTWADQHVTALNAAIGEWRKKVEAAPHAANCANLCFTYPPMPNFSGMTCKSIMGCGHCERCHWLAVTPRFYPPCGCWKATALKATQ